MKTYLDSGVLIVAFRAQGEAGLRANQILDDEQREFVSSPFSRLELLPKAIYHRQVEEQEFYQAFFDAVQIWANDIDLIIQEAYEISARYGLAAMDALHVSAALSIGADELITTEKTTKPMHRVSELKVMSILDSN